MKKVAIEPVLRDVPWPQDGRVAPEDTDWDAARRQWSFEMRRYSQQELSQLGLYDLRGTRLIGLSPDVRDFFHHLQHATRSAL